ncbi:MAG: hypothetical protein BWX99_02804 [Deltaproteobacteria bacterium ADurb.Bin151]|nr:MAG: hypothetical protein BWX99_02804 [Deltaproteobacteria bacterium ADurb.Bin151]
MAYLRQFGRKGLYDTVRIQAGLHSSIFIHVIIVVIINKAAVLELQEGCSRQDCQGKANQRRNPVFMLGCVRAESFF